MQSAVAGDAQIYLGSDDGVAVWINGKQAHSNPIIRDLQLDSDVFEANLKAGTNRCLVKVSQETGNWGFAMRVLMLPKNRAVISGIITDEKGKPIPNADVRLEQVEPRLHRDDELRETLSIGDGSEIAKIERSEIPSIGTKTDTSGKYRINISPVRGAYDLSATEGERGDWQLGIRLREGERRTLNLTLKEAISIEGTLLMLDDATPHAAVPVQAVLPQIPPPPAPPTRGGEHGEAVTPLSLDGRYPPSPLAGEGMGVRAGEGEPVVIAGTLSDEGGKYRFINLKPGRYQVRCQILGGYVYYKLPSPSDGRGVGGEGETLQIQRGKTLKNIDFRFAPFKKGTWKNYKYLDGLGGNLVAAIHRDPSGVMWFGTFLGGVFRYDGKEFVNFTTTDGLVDHRVWAIHQDPDGSMWFGTYGGVSRYDGKGFVNFTTKDGLASNYVSAIHRDPSGVMWFATSGGVSRYDGKAFVNFTTKEGLANNSVRAIYRDPSGVMWFATSGGVSRYDGKGFVNFTTKEGLASNYVSAIHRDPSGVMWFATSGGVSRYDGKAFVNFTKKDGLASNYAYYIHRAPSGMMWFGTPEGVSRYDGKGFRNFTTKDGLVDNLVYFIHSNPDGVMWFGTPEGVSRYDGKGFVNFTTKDGLAGNKVFAIYRDPDGVMWFGTLDGGVSRYDGKRFVNFTEKDGLVGNYVCVIYRGPDGIMWLGTATGVSRYDGKRFVNFTKKDGMAGRDAVDMHRASDGILWFAHWGAGVSGYDGIAWTSLDTRDGLAGNIVGAIDQNSDGALWFGTDRGLTRYRRSPIPPGIRIVSVRTDKQYTDLSAIPPITTDTRVTIAYNAIDLKTLIEKRQYRVCILKGVAQSASIKKDADYWLPPTKESTFDHIFKKPGAYTFAVQAIDRDLNYSEPASLTLKVVPPFYMRIGFLAPTGSIGTILLAALTVSLIVLFKHRRRISAYQKAAVQELQDARQMQMSLIPETAPPVEGVEIAGKCVSANTVGGDFFDYLQSKDKNEIGIVIADVTGKGLKGAMNAVMADGILHAKAEEMEQLSAASLMMKINDVLKARMERDMNVTMVIGVICRNRVFGKNSVSFGENSVSEGEITLTLANAAHHAHPLLLRDNEIQALKTGGLPLGMRAGIKYSEEQFPLESGDVVILMTDGIIEAKDSNEQLYSDSGRLEKTISQFTQEQSAETMVEAILNDAMDFGGDKTTRDDDMTVVVAKVQ